MTTLPIFMRPSVKITEIDLTQRIKVINSTMGVVVGEFERGPLDNTYITGVAEGFTDKYGLIANPALSFAHDTVVTFMTQSTNCLVKRVTNAAKHAGLSVVYDADRKRLVTFPFVTGSATGYSAGQSKLVLLSFVGTFVTANSFAMDITNGTTITAITPVVFATDHNTTLTNIAAAIQTTMNTFGTGGSATVYTETTSSGAQKYIVAIRAPASVDLSFINPVLTLGVTRPTVSISTSANLFDIFAENPGDWANEYGIKLTNFDPGVRERYKFTLSGPIVTGNTFSCLVNGTSVSVPFNTSSDATLQDIAAAFAALPTISSATVETVAGATDNDRTILIIGQIPGRGKLTFDSVTITGSNAPVMIVDKYLTGTDPDNTFYIEVFSRTNTSTPVERFEVSLQRQVSGLGAQQNIEYVVNTASSRAINIRVKQLAATALPSYTLYDATTGDMPSAETNIRFMAGGDDGVAATSANIAAAWSSLDDRVNWPFNTMLNAGYTAKSVQKAMVALAELRSDSTAILDAPSDKQSANDLRLYRINDLDIDTSYAAMYTPDIQIEDVNTGELRWIPPSGPVGATYAYSDRLTSQMGAPAGLNRGKVPLAMDLRYRYSNGDCELLHPIGINVILDKKLTGPTVFDEETLQVKSTILSSVHARRILNLIKTGLADGLEWTLFDPNTESTRYQAVELGHTLLGPIKKAGGLYNYKIVCDDNNNTPDVIDADVLAYDVYLKIIRVIKGIAVRAILTRTGVSFEEVIANIDSI